MAFQLVKHGQGQDSHPDGKLPAEKDKSQQAEHDPEKQSNAFQSLHWCAIALAAWLVSTALTLYNGHIPNLINDSICGAAISLLACAGLIKKSSKLNTFIQWASALIAAWMMFAPLVTWTKSASAYDTDNLVAILLVAIYWIAPKFRDDRAGVAEIPPGWDYNPSSWEQRLPLIALAMVGYFIARYLACCQLGYVSPPWDPVFQDGTARTLNSEVSKAFIISDAGLGAVSYLIDTLAGAIGGKSRWQTMPWMVVLFGLLVVPPGVVSIVLVILQPVAVGSWCFLCLVAAFNMLIMVPLALDEVIATCQYLQRAKQAGHGYLQTMCLGTAVYMDKEDNSEAKPTAFDMPPAGLLVSTLASAGLLAAPHFLRVTEAASLNCYIVGALAMTFSVMAFAEVCRPVRLLNLLLAAWLIASLMFLPGYSQVSVYTIAVAATVIGLCSISRGKIMHRYGAWTKFIQ